MKLLIDMNLSPAWVAYLAGEGIEAVHWSSMGPGNASDEVIMTFAARENFIIFTHNLDFGAMLAAGRGEKPSVIQVRADDLSPRSIGEQIVRALRQMADALAEGAC